jgi:C1A family cysteine protease
MAARDQIDVAAVRAALQEHDHPWVAQENALTRMIAKSRVRRLGIPLPDAPHRATLDQRASQIRAQVRQAPAGAAAALPSKFDLRDVSGQNYVSGVRDQGDCGSCVAFGSVAIMEGTARYSRRMAALDVDLSEAHLRRPPARWRWARAARLRPCPRQAPPVVGRRRLLVQLSAGRR